MISNDAPAFNNIVNAIIAKSSLQKKKLSKHLSTVDTQFFARAEEFAIDYGGYLASQGITFDYSINAYLSMCNSMFKCQVEFMKTGIYRTEDHDQAFVEVYSNPEVMKSYMIALAMSQFLWSTHYKIYLDFERSIVTNSENISSYLEIGPGHGLYLRNAIKHLRPSIDICAVDISPISIEITKSIIKHFYPKIKNVTFWTGDMLSFDTPIRYDFITMGEVLEHVNEPHLLLCRLESLLSNSGRAFVTTSINSPAVDHVFHYKSVEEVRIMIISSGLKILREQILPVEDLPMKDIISQRITINYSAEVARNCSNE